MIVYIVFNPILETVIGVFSTQNKAQSCADDNIKGYRNLTIEEWNMMNPLRSVIQTIKRARCKHYSHYYFDGKDVVCPDCGKAMAEVVAHFSDFTDITITFDKNGKARW